MIARKTLGLLVLSFCAINVFADDPFAIVFIDKDSERQFGFPVDRRVVGRALGKISKDGAKAVVLKFFYDQPHAGEDQEFAQALSLIPCALQGCIMPGDTNTTRPVPQQFIVNSPQYPRWLSGTSGWLPVPELFERAAKFGFVDLRDVRSAPLLECYQGKAVPSLYCSALEFATGTKANFERTNCVIFGNNWLPIDAHAETSITFPTNDSIFYIPFHKILADDSHEFAPMLRQKVVILGYDGGQITAMPTPIGSAKLHRLFVYQLRSLYEQLLRRTATSLSP